MDILFIFGSNVKKYRTALGVSQEKFAEKCINSKTINGKSYSCAYLKKQGLERAFVNNNIIVHGGIPYEGGTDAEVVAGKNSGDYCLGASETWNHYGEKRCVFLRYRYLACSNGYCFLNQRIDYKKGFVAFFGKYNMYTWSSFKKTFMNHNTIVVCGTIKKYQGHPEIAIYGKSQFVIDPIPSYRGTHTVYQYSCN